MNLRRSRYGERGNAMVEAAMTLPILLVLMVGIFEVGRAYETWQVVTNASREGARVAVRHVRRDGLEVLKKMEKDHTISEDEHKRHADAVQKATDQAIHDVDAALAAKEKEIMTV